MRPTFIPQAGLKTADGVSQRDGIAVGPALGQKPPQLGPCSGHAIQGLAARLDDGVNFKAGKIAGKGRRHE